MKGLNLNTLTLTTICLAFGITTMVFTWTSLKDRCGECGDKILIENSQPYIEVEKLEEENTWRVGIGETNYYYSFNKWWGPTGEVLTYKEIQDLELSKCVQNYTEEQNFARVQELIKEK